MNTTLTRAISGAVYVVLLVGSILYSHHSLVLLFGVLMLICSYEFAKLTQLPYTLTIAVAVFFYAGFYFVHSNYTLLYLSLFAVLIQFKALRYLFEKKHKPLDSLSKWLYLVGYLTASLILITKLPMITKSYNPRLVLGIFIIIWVNDTFAYLIGKSIGQHKLFEKVSPKKTREGFIGGLVFSCITGMILAYFLFLENLFLWLFVALLISIFSTLGDLFESKLKRIAQVKDSGTIMPGHGGMLDRLDSIIFVTPIVYLLYQILHYVS